MDSARGTWTIRVRELGSQAGQLREPPKPTHVGGKGISLFTGRPIDSEYINRMAQSGQMGRALYAVAFKTPQGLRFQAPDNADLVALKAAEAELCRLRPDWERSGVIPTERIPEGDKTSEPMARGIVTWADMFSSRQLLCAGVLVEELRRLRTEIVAAEGAEAGEATIHLLAFAIDKFLNWNAILSSWNAPFGRLRSVFDRHDFSFKTTFAEMAPCYAGAGLEWVTRNVLKACRELTEFPRHPSARPAEISQGSATSLPQIADGSITAVVIDPPYAGNVQYSELADFFYVWLKRTQGHRRPEWFSTYLSEHDEEAVVNISRHRGPGGSAKAALEAANAFYQRLMTDTFRECHRILRDDGVLTVMFTHKKQEAWEAVFEAIIKADFSVSATWPVKTESEHSLHQAKKNAAQSTVILVARKRLPGAGSRIFNLAFQREIQEAARARAERLKAEGLNPVDQLVGSFGPAMEVFSRYEQVRTDTGQEVRVGMALELASDAVSNWRVEQLAERGLDGVEAEGRFALLCWDVLGAGEFRFNEARLLGHAVGMDVDRLIAAGLVQKKGENVLMLSAAERRRERALEREETVGLFGPVEARRRRSKAQALKIHPNDLTFRTALDACHALALRYVEAGGPAGGVGAAQALRRQQGWGPTSPVARLMDALVRAAPPALRHEGGPKSAAAKFPEFRAWHALLQPLFGVEPPDWSQRPPLQPRLLTDADEAEDEDDETEDET